MPGGDSLPYFVGTALMEKTDIIHSLPDADRLGVITVSSSEEVNVPGYYQEEIRNFGDLKFIWLSK
jgi:hypothetical protein